VNESATLPRISLAVLALVATLLVAVPQPAAALSTYLNVDQLDVNNAVDAAVEVSGRAFTPEDTTAVVLATDGNFPDGLSASALAGSVGGPILFTQLLELPQQTRDEIDRLLDAGDTVYLMGGTAVISPAVEDELAEEYTTVRVAGSTRLETAAESADLVGVDDEQPRVIIARAFGPDGANTPSDRTTGWVDAISCGAFAAASGIPILLTETDVLSDTTEDALRDLDPDEAIVCGGTAAVAASVVGDINDLGIEVERVAGITRVETAIDAARTLFGATTAAGGTFSVVPGYGEAFGYGLAAAPLGHPILLVGTFEPTLCSDGSQPSRETLCYLRTAGEETAQLVVVGDEDVIADPVVDALGEAAGGRDIADIPTLGAPQNVAATDDINDGGTQATVSWNAVADPDDILAGYQVFINGQAAPGNTPTAGPNATSAVVGGLEPDVEASITVAAIDVGDRQGAMSEPATVTPEDEVPEAISNFEATPQDSAVALTWDVGPIDTASYTISRAEEDDLLGFPIGCVSFSELVVIEQPSATTFTDDTAENGTGSCYQRDRPGHARARRPAGLDPVPRRDHHAGRPAGAPDDDP
jgi:putative cell wall-binding protein